ncbi:Uncharacterised protein [uncultured archaeon]|nr:Uncharacterised protein [uncultured archaeon]
MGFLKNVKAGTSAYPKKSIRHLDKIVFTPAERRWLNSINPMEIKNFRALAEKAFPKWTEPGKIAKNGRRIGLRRMVYRAVWDGRPETMKQIEAAERAFLGRFFGHRLTPDLLKETVRLNLAEFIKGRDYRKKQKV